MGDNMKKLFILILSIVMLSGCTKDTTVNEQDSLTKYESYLNTLIEQDRYVQDSYYYDIYAILNKLEDGTTRYDIIIENPQVAMYNIEILVAESTAKRSDMVIYPCIGIFDEESYTLIPNQSNTSEGYIEAICLSGVTTVEEPVLNILVTWKDYAKLTTTREFIKLFPSYPVEEVEENTEEEIVEEE